MVKVFILATMTFMLNINAQAQITATSINKVHLRTPMDKILRKVRFEDSPYRSLFSANPPGNFYFLLLENGEDSCNVVKFLIAQTGRTGKIIQLYAYIDASDIHSLIEQINAISNKHSMATSTIGEPSGNAVHGWSTDQGTTIISTFTDVIDRAMGFAPTVVSIFYKTDSDEIGNSFFNTKF